MKLRRLRSQERKKGRRNAKRLSLAVTEYSYFLDFLNKNWITWIDIGRYLMTLIWADRADPELF